MWAFPVAPEPLEGPGERGKGLRSTDWPVQSSEWDGKHSMGNTAHNRVRALCGASGVLEIPGEHFVKGTIL